MHCVLKVIKIYLWPTGMKNRKKKKKGKEGFGVL